MISFNHFEDKLSTKVILLTAYDDLEQVIHSMHSGASAFQPKYIEPEKLVETIRSVASGKLVVDQTRFDRTSFDLWMQDYTERGVRLYSDSDEQLHPLSCREMEVLSYITQGMTNQEIALMLGIGHQTLKNKVSMIYRKLSVDDRTQATLFALRRGWFRLHEQEQELGRYSKSILTKLEMPQRRHNTNCTSKIHES